MQMSPRASDTALILALLASRGVGERSLSRWLTWTHSRGVAPADWLAMRRDERVRQFPAKTESIAVALDRLDDVSLLRAEKGVQRVHHAGGQFLLVTQSDYPAALVAAAGPAAPPVLTVLGDIDLFTPEAGAVVGTRTPSEPGSELARYCARWYVSRSRTVVSGAAQGIDSVAHRTALDAGGATIAVLPQGLLSFSVAGAIATAVDGGAALLISQFAPDAPWTTGGAVTRNATIAALSRMICVIEPHSPGGSMKTGRDGLAQGKRVMAYSGVGSQGDALIREGALPILGPEGRFSDEFFDEAWESDKRAVPRQIDLL